MNFVPRFVFRFHPQICKTRVLSNALYLSKPMSFSTKYGKLINDNVSGAFYLPIGDGTEMGAILYEKKKGGLLNLHHTEVPPHLQNNGIGHDLAKEVFEYCSARNLKVLLTCEFLQKYIEENPKYKDLVVVREKMNV